MMTEETQTFSADNEQNAGTNAPAGSEGPGTIDSGAVGSAKRGFVRSRKRRTSLFAAGEPMIWLTGGALIVCVGMVLGLLALVLVFGLSTFWPLDIVKVTTLDGGVYMGEVTRGEDYKPDDSVLAALSAEAAERARNEMDASDGSVKRRLYRTGNFRLTQNHFNWVDDFQVEREERPEWALVIERLEWGRFYGFPESFAVVASFIEPRDGKGDLKSPDSKKAEAVELMKELAPRHGGTFWLLAEVFENGETQKKLFLAEEAGSVLDIIGVAEVVEGPERVWAMFNRFHDEVRRYWNQRRDLEKHDTGDVNAIEEEARLAMREAQLELDDAEEEYGSESTQYFSALGVLEKANEHYVKTRAWAEGEFARIRKQIEKINHLNGRYLMTMATAGEGNAPPQRVMLRLDDIVRAYPANQLTFTDRIKVYSSRWWEYLSDEPREANNEGGVFPAIFGTIVMTLMMALAVVPFGVLAALYLREYAKAGPVVSAVRIAVNNLAGVPSIVFGVFGLGFFCYGVGSFIDGGPSWAMPKPTWFVLLGAASVTGTGAFLFLIKSFTRPGVRMTTRQRTLRYVSLALWSACSLTVIVLVATTPFFDGFYRAQLPSPTFGKSGLIWASFTLALLTLPVVIVATEEALAAVPNSMREGSYACGASKWQTIKRIVMPRAMPGIMTGMILAMARGAGEVAPLMLVGAVKFVQELPFEWSVPFGLNRSFMHLGFHIYDVGFQSQNSEAAKPMVFTTTLLLILIVAVLNVSAIWLRSRLRRRFIGDQF
jgi:ABC-type phosphate transport system permease subunit/ABC-type phosphate transport system auxiliary subunit